MDAEYEDILAALIRMGSEPRPVCNECAGTGDDCGLPCLACDGRGYKYNWSATTNMGAAPLTPELLDRAFFRMQHPMREDL